MMMNPELSSLAEAEIDTLEAEGIKLSPADIVEINALAWELEKPQNRVDLARGTPIFVGNVALWPRTMQAITWFGRIEPYCLGQRGKTEALAYSMAHSYDESGVFDKSVMRSLVNVKRWICKLPCRYDALLIAVSDVINQDYEPEQPPVPQEADSEGLSLGGLSALLSAATNESAEFWERRCTVPYSMAVLENIIQQNKVDDKPLSCDPKIMATRALGWAVEKIRRRNKDNG